MVYSLIRSSLVAAIFVSSLSFYASAAPRISLERSEDYVKLHSSEVGVVRETNSSRAIGKYFFAKWRTYLDDRPIWFALDDDNGVSPQSDFISAGGILAVLDGNRDGAWRTWIVAKNGLRNGPPRSPGLPNNCKLDQLKGVRGWIFARCTNRSTYAWQTHADGALAGPYQVQTHTESQVRGASWLSVPWIRAVLHSPVIDSVNQVLRVQATSIPWPAGNNGELLIAAADTLLVRDGRKLYVSEWKGKGPAQWKSTNLPAQIADAPIQRASRSALVAVGSPKPKKVALWDLQIRGYFRGAEDPYKALPGGVGTPSAKYEQISCFDDGSAMTYDPVHGRVAKRSAEGTWTIDPAIIADGFVGGRGAGLIHAPKQSPGSIEAWTGANNRTQTTGLLGLPGIASIHGADGQILLRERNGNAMTSGDSGTSWQPIGTLRTLGGVKTLVHKFNPDNVRTVVLRSGILATNTNDQGWQVIPGSSIGCGYQGDSIQATDIDTIMTPAGISFDNGLSWKCFDKPGEQVSYLSRIDYGVVVDQSDIKITNGKISSGSPALVDLAATKAVPKATCARPHFAIVGFHGGLAELKLSQSDSRLCISNVGGSSVVDNQCTTVEPGDPRGDNRLLRAARHNNVEAVVKILRANPAAKMTLSLQGYSALTTAAASGATEVVVAMHKQAGVSLSEVDGNARSALGAAAETGQIKSILTLLEYGANARQLSANKDVALIAQQAGNDRAYYILIGAQAQAELLPALKLADTAAVRRAITKYKAQKAEINGLPILHIAAATGDKDVIQELINLGADIRTAPDGSLVYDHVPAGKPELKDFLRVLIETARAKEFAAAGQWSDFALSIEAGADPNADVNGKRFVFLAVEAQNLEAVRALSKPNVEWYIKGRDRRTPIQIAITAKKGALIEAVLTAMGKKGKQIGAKYVENYAKAKSMPWIKFLLSHGVDAKGPSAAGLSTGSGETLLHVAAKKNYLPLIKELVKRGADVTATTRSGVTPLMLTAIHADTKPTEFLLSKGANVNAQDAKGETALMYATKRSRIATIKVLVAAGADITLENLRDDTAEDIADDLGLKEIEDYLDDLD